MSKALLNDIETLEANNEYLVSLVSEQVDEIYKLNRRLNCCLENIDTLEEEVKEKDNTIESLNDIHKDIYAGNEHKDVYLHESETLFARDGELHILNEDLSLVINVNTFVHDLPMINRLVTQEAKKQLNATIEELNQ